MHLDSDEKETLLEVLDKHIKFMDSMYKKSTSNSNMRQRHKIDSKIANLENIRMKVQND